MIIIANTIITCGESHSRTHGTWVLVGRFDAGHQASEAERGRVLLMGDAVSGILDKLMGSLLLNRRIPLYAEAVDNEAKHLTLEK